MQKGKKYRLTVSIDHANFLLLKWLDINGQGCPSFTVNGLLTRYRNEVTKGMTTLEIQQIEELKLIGEKSILDMKKVSSLRTTILLGQVDETLKDKEKRAALKDLIHLYDND